MTSVALDDTDRALLAAMQQRFPLEHRPFAVLGQKVGLTEQGCLDRAQRYRSDGVIRRIAARFDVRALGYQHTIVAMRLAASSVDAAAEAVLRHPGVAFAASRNDPFNFWFSLAVPPDDSLEQVVQILHSAARSDETLLLPTSRVYKSEGRASDGPALEDLEDLHQPHRGTSKPPLSAGDVALLRLLQDDLPLIEMPYAVWAEQADTSERELFDWMRRMEHQGYMQPFAAVAGHAASLPPVSTALVVWQIPEYQVDAVGEQLARWRDISHCYRRPVYRGWPYALYTVLHAETFPGCMDVVRRIAEQVGQFPHKNLFSIKEYRRAAIRYFDPQVDDWWRVVGGKIAK